MVFTVHAVISQIPWPSSLYTTGQPSWSLHTCKSPHDVHAATFMSKSCHMPPCVQMDCGSTQLLHRARLHRSYKNSCSGRGTGRLRAPPCVRIIAEGSGGRADTNECAGTLARRWSGFPSMAEQSRGRRERARGRRRRRGFYPLQENDTRKHRCPSLPSSPPPLDLSLVPTHATF